MGADNTYGEENFNPKNLKMKSTILNIKKRVVVVEIPEGSEITVIGNDKEVYYAIKNDGRENYTKIADGKEWRLIGNYSEDILKAFLHQSIHTGLFAHYVKDIPVNTYCYKSALDSFISAIESNGFTWNSENPYTQKPYEGADDYDVWKEFEAKNFHPEQCLLFEML